LVHSFRYYQTNYRPWLFTTRSGFLEKMRREVSQLCSRGGDMTAGNSLATVESGDGLYDLAKPFERSRVTAAGGRLSDADNASYVIIAKPFKVPQDEDFAIDFVHGL